MGRGYIIIKLIGGIGNQMFQYAYGESYKSLTGINVLYDTYAIKHKDEQITEQTKRNYKLNVFNTRIEELPITTLIKYSFYYHNRIEHIIGKVYRKFKHFDFIDISREAYNFHDFLFQPVSNPTYILGYFQHIKYILPYQDNLQKDFLLKEKLTPYYNHIKFLILNSPTAVSIHIRRGDYLSHKEIFNILPKDYYKSAMSFFRSKFPNCCFFCFSDDMQKAREILNDENNIVFVESTDGNEHEEIHLMSLCQHNIIANSTFSWWGAFLNLNKEKKVIAPQHWLNKNKPSINICPPNWILI